jgi:hypothetical protein
VIRSLAVKAVTALLIAHRPRHVTALAPWRPRLPSYYGKSTESSPLYAVMCQCVVSKLSNDKYVTALLTLLDQDHSAQVLKIASQQLLTSILRPPKNRSSR